MAKNKPKIGIRNRAPIGNALRDKITRHPIGPKQDDILAT